MKNLTEVLLIYKRHNQTNPDEVGKPPCKFGRVLVANHWTFLERQQQGRQTLNSPCKSRAHPVVTLHHHYQSHRHQQV